MCPLCSKPTSSKPTSGNASPARSRKASPGSPLRAPPSRSREASPQPPKTQLASHSQQTERARVIAAAKDTLGYHLYLKAAPKHARGPEHPATPPISTGTNDKFGRLFALWNGAVKEHDPQRLGALVARWQASHNQPLHRFATSRLPAMPTAVRDLELTRPVQPAQPTAARRRAPTTDALGATADTATAVRELGRQQQQARPTGTGKRKKGTGTAYVSPLLQFRAYRLSPFFSAVAAGPRARGRQLSSNTWSNRIEPHRIVCRYALHGVCNDPNCCWQHPVDFKLGTTELLEDVVAYDTRLGGDDSQRGKKVAKFQQTVMPVDKLAAFAVRDVVQRNSKVPSLCPTIFRRLEPHCPVLGGSFGYQVSYSMQHTVKYWKCC